MNKAYIVYEHQNSTVVAVFLDEEKCNMFIEEKNKKWNQIECEMEQCEKCRKCNDGEEVYLSIKSCKRASVAIDEYGTYCKNYVDEFDDRPFNYYSKHEVDLIK